MDTHGGQPGSSAQKPVSRVAATLARGLPEDETIRFAASGTVAGSFGKSVGTRLVTSAASLGTYHGGRKMVHNQIAVTDRAVYYFPNRIPITKPPAPIAATSRAGLVVSEVRGRLVFSSLLLVHPAEGTRQKITFYFRHGKARELAALLAA